jgi:hypothetical protein
MAGFPNEKAGIDAIPLLFKLTFAEALSFVLTLSAGISEYEFVRVTINRMDNNNLISWQVLLKVISVNR